MLTSSRTPDPCDDAEIAVAEVALAVVDDVHYLVAGTIAVAELSRLPDRSAG